MSGRGYVRGRLAAALFIAVLGLVLAAMLKAPGARSPLREPYVPKSRRGVAASVELEARESRKRTTVYRLTLSLPDAAVLLDHEELQFFVSIGSARRELVRGELRVRGPVCVLAAQSDGDLAAGQPVGFRKVGGCAVERSTSVDADMTLELRAGGPVALLGFQPLEGAPPGPIQVRSGAAAIDARGAFLDYTPAAPRVVLLVAMWRRAGDPGWLWAALIVAIALACAGSAVFPTRRLSEDVGGVRRAIVRAVVGAILAATSLGVLYSSLVPPFMAPDEPYHLLGFAELAKNRALAADAVVWMGETHLWRIRYQPTERFRSIDVGRPYVVDDDQLKPTEVARRSAVLARLWEAVAPLADGRSAFQVLLGLRLLNVAVFALAVGAATALATLTVGEPFPQWLAIPLLLVPSLPFFAMHVSETALLCSIYVLLATAVAVMFLDGPRAHWAGIPLGLATGLMLAGGRSPWPLAGLIAAALVGRVMLGSRSVDSARPAFVFWSGYAAGSALLFATQNEAYRSMTLAWAARFTAGIPVWLVSVAQWLLDRPYIAVALVGAAAFIEIAMRRPREWISTRLATRGQSLARAAALSMCGLILASLAGSLVASYPQLELEPRRALTAFERVADVLATTATLFRLREPNFLLSTSFWVGFGWLDTSPGPVFQGAVVFLVAVSLLSLLRYLARSGDMRRMLWLLVLTAGAALALVLYTITTQVSKPLHGRYLIGGYLCLVTVAGSALTLDRTPKSASTSSSGSGRAAVVLVAAGLIHVYCLCFILARYF